MNIIDLRIEEVIPYEKNPRKNDKAVKQVAESIKQFGFKVPIVIDKNNIIVTGHTRLKAAKKLKLKTVPCVIADDLTEEQIKAFRLADNKVSELAEWDFDLLSDELEDLKNFGMDAFGFGDDLEAPEIPDEMEKVKEDNYDDSIEIQTRVKYGDLWKLGQHYLKVGDATKEEDIDDLVKDNIIDLVETDPPYNQNIEVANRTIQNDSMSSDAYREFLIDAYKNIEKNLKDGGAFYVWYLDREHINNETALKENNLRMRQVLIWEKEGFSLSGADYQHKKEHCMYGWKDGKRYFIDERNNADVIKLVEDICEKDITKMKKEELIKIVQDFVSEYKHHDIKYCLRNKESAIHPTMKPVELIAYQIHNSTKQGEKVLDLFGGSGTTLIACEQLNRQCFINEFDEEYASKIIDRWEKFTGQTAELLERKE